MSFIAFAFLAVTTQAPPAPAQPSASLVSMQSALNDAKSLSVTFMVQPIGGLREEYTIELQKPNSVYISAPGRTTYADGHTITVFDKAKNRYSQQPEISPDLATVFGSKELAVWFGFLNPNAYGSLHSNSFEPTAYRELGTVARGSNNYNGVEAHFGDDVVTYLLDPSDNLPRQATFVTGEDKNTTILFVRNLTRNPDEPATRFAFSPPSGAKEVTPEEMAGPRWFESLLAAENAAGVANKKILVEFMTAGNAPSIQMEKEVFDTDKFSELALKHFVLLRVDVAQQKRVGARYGINVQTGRGANPAAGTNLPVLAFLDSRGKVLNQATGYPGPDPVFAFINAQIQP